MEQFQDEKPDIFHKIRQAWSLARPIKAPYSEINKVLIKSSEIGKILKRKEDEMEDILYPGGIYSIFSEKTQYGMGKSQFAYFLRALYENISSSGITEYHIFDPSDVGFIDFEDNLRRCFNKCNRNTEFFFLWMKLT